MANWKKYKLGDVVEIIKNGYQPSREENLKYVGLEHIEQQSLRLASIGKSSDIKSNKFRFQSGDILFGKLRPYFRKVYRPKFSGVCSTDIWVVRAKEGFDPGYLFYFMANEEFISLSNQGSNGTRMPRADWNDLKNSEWDFPVRQTQTQIASILSALDEKIELNRRINQTLEQIAQTLFKKYFVDDIDEDNLPDGWRSGKLEELFVLQRGFDLPSTERVNGNIEVIAASGVNGFHNKAMVKGPGITTGRSGVIGNVFYVVEDFWPLNTSLYVKEFKISSPLHALYVLRSIDLNAMNGGSAVPTLNRNHVHSLDCIIPPKEAVAKFQKIVSPLFESMNKINKENKTLARIRDSLLPKLMSGEIDVDNLLHREKKVQECDATEASLIH